VARPAGVGRFRGHGFVDGACTLGNRTTLRFKGEKTRSEDEQLNLLQ
jgi:hypothetical protein